MRIGAHQSLNREFTVIDRQSPFSISNRQSSIRASSHFNLHSQMPAFVKAGGLRRGVKWPGRMAGCRTDASARPERRVPPRGLARHPEPEEQEAVIAAPARAAEEAR